MTESDTEHLQEAVLEWFDQNHRKLPVRETRDPYAVWISEIMLQQTTVAAVMPFWERFMARFPTLRALAEATLDDVLHAWQGLGYYSRARNVHRAARQVMERHGGRFPERFEDVLALPGVGRYTAGAVLSLAFGQDLPVVDANVTRVLARICLIEGDPKSTRTHKELWLAAERLLPQGHAREWNLALFDIGATLCVPVNPHCMACPAAPWCGAFRTGRQNDFPQHAPKEPLMPQTDVAAVIRDADGRLLMVRRPDTGLWAGLWEVPRGTLEPGESPEAGLARTVKHVLGVDARIGARVTTVKHGVMRRSITLLAFETVIEGEPDAANSTVWRWVGSEDLEALALPSPQRRLLAAIRAQEPDRAGNGEKRVCMETEEPETPILK